MPASSPPLSRLLITLICLSAGLAGIWYLYQEALERRQASITIIELPPPDKAEMIRDPEAWKASRAWIQNFPESTLARFRLSEEETRKVVPQLQSELNRYDPFQFYSYAPNLDLTVRLSEHPGGGYLIITNSLGMRRDGEIAQSKPDLRVLIAGDSHPDGVCNNAEAFPALIEEELEERYPGRSVEFLNASRGGFGPLNYLGTLEKFSSLSPDRFILWFTGSNDFVDSLYMARRFHGDPVHGLPKEFEDRRNEARQVNMAAYTSGVHSAYHLLVEPRNAEYSIDLCRKILLEIHLLCERDGIEALIVYLPPPLFLPRSGPCVGEEEIIEILGFPREALAQQTEEMEAKLTLVCEELDIPLLNLRPALGDDAEKYFYSHDLHLNPAGHELVRRALLEFWSEYPELDS